MIILKDDDTEYISIDGKRIKGFVSKQKCIRCDSHLVLNEEYDSYFCPYCNSWTEEKCGEEDCFYCQDRPEKPL